MEQLPHKKKILITGAGGFLGWNLCRVARDRYDVVGIFHVNPLVLDGVGIERCNITRFDELRELLFRTRPDAVVHAAAIAGPDYCQEHPEQSAAVNVDASVSIAGLCNDLEVPCAFISTDLVFDGAGARYNEACPVSPISVYGEQKARAETLMRARHHDLRICRMPLMFGDAKAPAQSFIQPLIRSFSEGAEPALFIDEYRTPASALTAAQGILCALENGPGIYHLGGRERISRYDFGVKLALALRLTGALIKRVFQKDVASKAPRPHDVSLDSAKAFSLGYHPGTIEEELRKLSCVLTTYRGC